MAFTSQRQSKQRQQVVVHERTPTKEEKNAHVVGLATTGYKMKTRKKNDAQSPHLGNIPLDVQLF